MPTASGASPHRPAEIVFLGLATLDLVVDMPRWPDRDGRLVVEPIQRAYGGPASTAAVAATRLGTSVAFIGAVGDDEAGELVVRALHAEGVNASLVRTVSGRTSESVILVDSSAATRSILHAPGVALDRIPPQAATVVAEAGWVHVDHAGWPLAREVPPDRLSVDAGNPIADLQLSGVGLYAPTAEALRARYPGLSLGACVRAALTDGASRVAVTLGSDGAIGADASGAWHAAPPAVPVRSTLGAGDAFHGALVARLAAGGLFPEAIREATSAAALSCRALDGRGAIPTLDELRRALASAPPVEPIVLGRIA